MGVGHSCERVKTKRRTHTMFPLIKATKIIMRVVAVQLGSIMTYGAGRSWIYG